MADYSTSGIYGNDYYIVTYRDVELSGLKVRVRG